MNKLDTILIIEDDKLDVKVLLKGLKETHYDCNIEIANNGKEALDYLHNPEKPKPKLIFVDINMPVMNGIEFLQAKSKDLSIKKIPSIVFTTSSKVEDRDDCYDSGVAGYMIKPIDYGEFKSLLHKVKDYWETSQFPSVN